MDSRFNFRGSGKQGTCFQICLKQLRKTLETQGAISDFNLFWTAVIPPLSPAPSISNSTLKISASCSNNKKIIYAGIPFRRGERVSSKKNMKDRIDKIIELFYNAQRKGCKFTLSIFGFSKEEYFIAIPDQKKYVEELGDSIIFHTFKPNKEIVNRIAESDFTILIRDVNRMTTAGFPFPDGTEHG